jgi:hypothetical protein
VTPAQLNEALAHAAGHPDIATRHYIIALLAEVERVSAERDVWQRRARDMSRELRDVPGHDSGCARQYGYPPCTCVQPEVMSLRRERDVWQRRATTAEADADRLAVVDGGKALREALRLHDEAVSQRPTTEETTP